MHECRDILLEAQSYRENENLNVDQRHLRKNIHQYNMHCKQEEILKELNLVEY